METKGLALAIIPPGLAIMVEAFTPLTALFFSRQADRIVRSEVGSAQPEPHNLMVVQYISTTKTLLENSMVGASSLAGLAPTFVSFIVSGFAILAEISKPYWWLLGLIVVFLVLIILILRVVSARSMLELETTRVAALKLRPTRLFSWLIYSTNIVLIVAALSIYLGYVR